MNQPIQPLRAAIARAFALSLGIAALTACGGSGGGDDNEPPPGDNTPPDDTDPPPGDDDSSETVTDRLYGLGAQFDDGGNLVIYAMGLREDGTPVTAADFEERAAITVSDEPAEAIDVSTVTEADGEIASISFLTDYSHSMGGEALQSVSEIYDLVVDGMPKVFNASALVFTTPLSDVKDGHPRPEYVKYLFDNDVGDGSDLKQAFAFDESIERKSTPLNDAVTWSLFGASDVPDVGVVQGLRHQCRPVRMLFAFADGEENGSAVWLGEPPVNKFSPGEPNLYERLDQHNITRFMLGVAWSGDEEVNPEGLENTLRAYAGDTGAHVLAYNSDQGVRTQATNLADALSEMTRLTVPAGEGQVVTVEVDGETFTIDVDKFNEELQACSNQ